MRSWVTGGALAAAALVGVGTSARATHPVCVDESDTYEVVAGQTLEFPVYVDDIAGSQYDDPVKLELDGAYVLPTGMTTSPALGTFFPPPGYGAYTFSWTPTIDQVGSYEILLHAIDTKGNVDGGLDPVEPCVFLITVTRPPSDDGTCPRTQGYWKNHFSVWPVSSLQLGSETYSDDELLAILKKPTKGDASIILAHQLIATLLNYAAGSDDSLDDVNEAIEDAQDLLAGFSGKLPYKVKKKTETRAAMIAAAKVLDDYNNGEFTDCDED